VAPCRNDAIWQTFFAQNENLVGSNPSCATITSTNGQTVTSTNDHAGEAHMGEQRFGKAKEVGSIPTSGTNLL
jgi:hypothetical protein